MQSMIYAQQILSLICGLYTGLMHNATFYHLGRITIVIQMQRDRAVSDICN